MKNPALGKIHEITRNGKRCRIRALRSAHRPTLDNSPDAIVCEQISKRQLVDSKEFIHLFSKNGIPY
jgi:hypothetical protein